MSGTVSLLSRSQPSMTLGERAFSPAKLTNSSQTHLVQCIALKLAVVKLL